jgi:hypothetical protein
VLGAGASVAESLARHAKWDKDRPPLDLDFFRRAFTAAREPSLIRRVEEHAARIGHPNPFTTTTPTSLEHYLGLLYFRLLHRPTTEDKSGYFDLVRLYNRELLSTTNWLVGRKRGPIEMLIRDELGHGNEVTVVTFNHDLLVEGALASLPPRDYGVRFCLQHSYGFDDDVQSLILSGADHWDLCPGGHGDVVRVCKLHGSLNWVFTTRDLNPSLNLATASKKKIHLLRLRRPRADLNVSMSRRSFYLWPVVVPPVYEKQGFIQSHLQAAWDAATDALDVADRVIFFGYSFPVADQHARFFFEGLAHRNRSLRSPIVINPDFRVAETAWEVLEAQAVHSFRSLADFLAEAA